MYAIIEIAGSQTIVKEKDIIQVNKLKNGAADGKMTIDTVLCTFSPDGKTVEIGTPYIAGKTVQATVTQPKLKGDKIVGAKFKRRKRYTRIFGHRQTLTELEIGKIGEKAQSKK